MSEAESGAVVARAREADPDAWEALYRHAYPRLFAYARRRLRSDDQADDAVSETMLRALHRIGEFTPTGAAGIEGWLFGIVRNVVLETYRDGARAAPTDLATLHVEPVSTDPDPVDRLVGQEEAGMLRVAFGRLSPGDRELLEMRVLAGLDSAQVGAATGRKPGAVRVAQTRALQRLRGAYEGLAR